VAVHDQRYRAYTGPRTAPSRRLLILPRYAFRSVFRSRIFTGFFAICFALPAGAAILIYLHYNLEALAGLRIQASQLLAINSMFFAALMSYQSFFLGFLVTLLAGPGLVSADLANNALPLYLSRPFSRAQYVLGKMLVLVILLSAITWVPGTILFLFQGSLAGAAWLGENLRIGLAIVAGCAIWIVVVSLLALALSAYVRRKVLAQAALLAFVFGGTVLAKAVNALFDTRWGDLLSLPEVLRSVWGGLYRIETLSTLPASAGFASLVGLSLVSLALLYRKLKAYEVAR
jgi:ABC-type transport system involved in multi-copper enzyme maturation permease subunit